MFDEDAVAALEGHGIRGHGHALVQRLAINENGGESLLEIDVLVEVGMIVPDQSRVVSFQGRSTESIGGKAFLRKVQVARKTRVPEHDQAPPVEGDGKDLLDAPERGLGLVDLRDSGGHLCGRCGGLVERKGEIEEDAVRDGRLLRGKDCLARARVKKNQCGKHRKQDDDMTQMSFHPYPSGISPIS